MVRSEVNIYIPYAGALIGAIGEAMRTRETLAERASIGIEYSIPFDR